MKKFDWCVRVSFAGPVLKGGHDVLPKLRDQSGSARTRIRQAPDAGGVTKDLQRRLKRYNEGGETGAPAPEPPRRAHHVSTQPVARSIRSDSIATRPHASSRSPDVSDWPS